MKLKKLCAAVMSGILAFSAMAGAIPSSDDGALLQATASITAESGQVHSCTGEAVPDCFPLEFHFCKAG